MMLCRRCRHRLAPGEDYVIGYSKASAMQWVYLCSECEEGLAAWIGMPPKLEPPLPVAQHETPPIPQPPVSRCTEP